MAGETRGVKLHIENVVKEYKGEHGTTIALNGVNLDIMENEFVCVVGPSGCGKSTLLNIPACTRPPAASAIWMESGLWAQM